MAVLSSIIGILFILSALEYVVFMIFVFKRQEHIERDLGPLTIRKGVVMPLPLIKSNYTKISDPHIRTQMKWLGRTIYVPLGVAILLSLVYNILSGASDVI